MAKTKNSKNSQESKEEAKVAKIEAAKSEKKEKNKVKEARPAKIKGKKYVSASKKVDSKKVYSLKDGIALIKTVKFADFDESVEVHMNLKTDTVKGEVELPYGTGKKVKVAIADETVISKIEKGVIDFDILLATPAFMPKLVKFARVLGPKGLMPNPKNGTVTADPEAAAKKFAGGAVRFKSEPKFPLLHQLVGKSSFENKQLIENVVALIKAIGKDKIADVFVATTMSPSVKIDLEKV